MKTRTILLLLGLTVLSGAFLTSCKDSGKDIPILKPLSEHLVGKWRWAESSGIKDGTWQEYIVPDDIYERVFLREDGTAQHIRTFDGGVYGHEEYRMDDGRRDGNGHYFRRTESCPPADRR